MRHTYSLTDFSENLVPFTARQVKSSLIWCAPDINNRDVLKDSCSYLIDPDNSAPAKIFYAERYGGSGIQRNGGGARCGFDGYYQIKGIGANPLVGNGSDRKHSSGRLDICDAIYEAFWSEMLGQVLPYGAVQTQAVLLVENDETPERALLVREPVLRPAHFERSPYFRPQSEYEGKLIHDTQRVRNVIRRLPECLPVPYVGFSKEATLDPQIFCIEGLCEMARRQAWQMAYCRTRFLRLTTSPSNISIDGRLLDFNGLRCFFPADHHYNFEYGLRIKYQMTDSVILQQGLSNLCIYLGKYHFGKEFTQVSCKMVDDTYNKTFQNACYFCYLDLLGIPCNIFEFNNIPDVLIRLANCIIDFLNSQSKVLHNPAKNSANDLLLQKMITKIIHKSLGNDMMKCEIIEYDIHYKRILLTFMEFNQWLAKLCNDKGWDFLFLMEQIEQKAKKRLQSRLCLEYLCMSKNISDIFNEYKSNTSELQKQFYKKGEELKIFARDALGYQHPVV
ncbi:MchC protein [Salmonella enterica subsp. diarizonae serovar 16:z10:e,n,x,z15]|uniref:MchC protein n=1 Tax=Salmonella enterica TaxID=28901 RepID=UPI0012C8D15A|nr:MchC protein [Salmonella enterica subsp. houtenae serovar 53:z4,z23:-]EEF3248589.1 MchC protein [Salmonella enterica]EEI9430010.1 MchC protein [Salmonella enterica subsp. diarizonae]MCH5484427.1 MchC protein [Salmonella enterica subsp. diarizonae serovar 16:z10:e,n,x,z15]HAF4898390.1 MchC protein [Salmonella enterica]